MAPALPASLVSLISWEDSLAGRPSEGRTGVVFVARYFPSCHAVVDTGVKEGDVVGI
jgi:hypothetical protein